MNPITYEQLPIDQILDIISKGALDQIKNCSVGLGRLEVEASSRSEIFSLIGSGTLVNIENTLGILTAHHVTDSKQYRDSDRICLMHREGAIDRTMFQRQCAQVIEIAKPSSHSQGPDLSLIIIPDPPLSWITKSKSFWKHKQEYLHSLHNYLYKDTGYWILVGFIDEKTKEVSPGDRKGRVFQFAAHAIISPVACVHDDNPEGYDIIDVRVDYQVPDPIPEDFGGMSGGGLWKVPFLKNQDGTINAGEPLLSGVIFYQGDVTNGSRWIRCNGKRSLYERVPEKLANVGLSGETR